MNTATKYPFELNVNCSGFDALICVPLNVQYAKLYPVFAVAETVMVVPALYV